MPTTWGIRSLHVCCLVVCLNFCTPTTGNRGNATTTVTSSTTTSSSVLTNCAEAALAECSRQTNCSTCLASLNASYGIDSLPTFYNLPPHGPVEATQHFYTALDTTPACHPAATPPPLLRAVLKGLVNSTCGSRHEFALTKCEPALYTCFLDASCRSCWRELVSHPAGVTASAILRSEPCTNAANNGSLAATFPCNGFPQCDYQKLLCEASNQCSGCLELLRQGDGAAAARACPLNASSPRMVNEIGSLITLCDGKSSVTCAFAQQWCGTVPECGACIAALKAVNGPDSVAIARVLASPVCRVASTNFTMRSLIGTVIYDCPAFTPCISATVACWTTHPNVDCILNHSASPQCPLELEVCFGASIDDMCAPCPAVVAVVNSMVVATAVVGAVSAVLCLWVVLCIVVHGRHCIAIRDRIVIGLLLSNTAYSIANTLPLNALGTNDHCGQIMVTFSTMRQGRAVWFGGKYGLVAFELLIVGASLHAIRRGPTKLGRWTEVALHVCCCTVALLAAAVFLHQSTVIDDGGYNRATENEIYTGAANHLGTDDDAFDDDSNLQRARIRFSESRDAYDRLVQRMLFAWDGMAAMTVVIWVVVRCLYHRTVRALREEVSAVQEREQRDEWADTRRSLWMAQRRALEAQRKTYDDVAVPLEPYVAVFVIFLIPAAVMSTDYCQRGSGARLDTDSAFGTDAWAPHVTYGVCDVSCELVLAFRSLCTVAVYLASRERRAEVMGVRSTCSKLFSWVLHGRRSGLVATAPHSVAEIGRFDQGVVLRQSPTDSDHAADLSEVDERAITKTRCLGRGAHGEVWAAILTDGAFGKTVALKVLCLLRDDDGDVANRGIFDEFEKEVAALKRVRHPHLITVLGFGTLSTGDKFIVTELMEGGSLEQVLHTTERALPWRVRTSIALQISLGMEHLHLLDMMHRDLKSPNVLLDADADADSCGRIPLAKVCDFGLARMAPPRPSRILHSAFTGITRELPASSVVETAKWTELQSLHSFVPGIDLSDSGSTKAAGTLLWMAPEVFRGDTYYTKAVDVYSFGVVLWELVTRQTPWSDLVVGGSQPVRFLDELSHALQQGRRPSIPESVVEAVPTLVALIQRCWVGDAANRPTFAAIASCLAECLRTEALD